MRRLGVEGKTVQRRTAVVSGGLALKMRRLRAAREEETGLEVLTLPLLAARLAGGFTQQVPTEQLQKSIRSALAAGGFEELDKVRDLPGMTRAVARTLTAAWRADAKLTNWAGSSGRIRDLLLIEDRIRESLSSAFLILPDLRDAALRRVRHGAGLFGEVVLDGLIDVDPLWRPLVGALCKKHPLFWRAVGDVDRRWFSGPIERLPPRRDGQFSSEICADPRAEVVEALRWARKLLSRGDVCASEVAIASTTTEVWDEHMLSLSRQAGLPIHFTRGMPALDTWEGQACASLADILLRGLSQPRLSRLLRRSPPKELPDDWAKCLKRGAGLFTVDQWMRALSVARPQRASLEAAEVVLKPLLELLSQGTRSGAEAGERFLRGGALTLWRSVLQAAPAEALEHSLAGARVPDACHPGASIAWGPAADLAHAPRPYVRLIGLTARAWPRSPLEDPLLPEHILPHERVEVSSRPDMDRLIYEVIAESASGELAISRSQRSSEGQLLPPSSLWPQSGSRVLARTRVPEHAFSDADRLLARPTEAGAEPRLASSRLCWRNWQGAEFTPHDGSISAAHPIIEACLLNDQSTTSLRRLLRDPIGYVWRHALGWHSVEISTDRLALDAREFGQLVHELLRFTVDELEAKRGLARANPWEVEIALDKAVNVVSETWPVERPVPPPLLWRRTLDEARRLSLEGLRIKDDFQSVRSLAEVGFGKGSVRQGPWNSEQPVFFAGLSIRGQIDRLDLSSSSAQVTDYKTGAMPKNAQRIVLAQGAELQRVVYAAAVRELLPEVGEVISRLVYLGTETSQYALSGDIYKPAPEGFEISNGRKTTAS